MDSEESDLLFCLVEVVDVCIVDADELDAERTGVVVAGVAIDIAELVADDAFVMIWGTTFSTAEGADDDMGLEDKFESRSTVSVGLADSCSDLAVVSGCLPASMGFVVVDPAGEL